MLKLALVGWEKLTAGLLETQIRGEKMNIDWDLIGKIAVIVGLTWAFTAFIKWIMAYIGRKKLNALKGTWHEYHWTNPGGADAKFKWLDSELIAKSGISSYKLKYTNNGILFCGTARYIDKRNDESSGDILLKVENKEKSATSKATIYFRYNIPERQYGNNNDEIAGIWLSYNFDEDITSGASILSRNKIPLNELDAKFKEYFEINNNASIIVRNNGTSGEEMSFWEKLVNHLR